MKLLLVTATIKESEGLTGSLEFTRQLSKDLYRGFAGSLMCDVLVTGPGAPATSRALTGRLAQTSYDLVINAGICGSFRRELVPGTAVNIVSERWADLGADNRGEFLDLFDLGLLKENDPPYSGRKLVNLGNPFSKHFSAYPAVQGISLNKAQGEGTAIEKCIRKFDPDVESMESAAFFELCISGNVNFQCLRTISNFVEPRDCAKWKIELALERLNFELKNILSAVSE